MQTLTVKSKQDSASQVTAYIHELGLELLQTNKDEQAQEEYMLLLAKFSRWPYKIYQFWLILGFAIALISQYFIVKGFWESSGRIVLFLQIILILGYIITEIGLLLSLYGCGQMLYAIKRKKWRSAQESLKKLQYSTIISTLESLAILWGVDLNNLFNVSSELWLVFAWALWQWGQLVGGSFVVGVFRESERVARENACDTSRASEETNPLVRDFLKQNEVLEEEVSKYDEQLNRLGVKVYRCWLKLMAIFEIARILGYLLFLLPVNVDDPWRKYVLTGFFLSSFLCIYSCFKMESAIAKKVVRSSERAVFVLKVCVVVAVISLFLAVRWVKGNSANGGEYESWDFLVPLHLFFFGYCCFIPVVTLLGAFKIHKIIKERDNYAKFSSINEATSNL